MQDTNLDIQYNQHLKKNGTYTSTPKTHPKGYTGIIIVEGFVNYVYF